MKTMQYLVRINPDPRSDLGPSVPDLPGCVATGNTIDSALRQIERAIELHGRGLREDGLPVPRPSHRNITPRRRPREIDFYAIVEVAASRLFNIVQLRSAVPNFGLDYESSHADLVSRHINH